MGDSGAGVGEGGTGVGAGGAGVGTLGPAEHLHSVDGQFGGEWLQFWLHHWSETLEVSVLVQVSVAWINTNDAAKASTIIFMI